jgi:hypothetical protein
MFVASVPLYVLIRSARVSSSWEVNLTLGNLLGGVLFLIFPLVGALIASRRPRNPIGWILLADGFLWMLTGMMDYYGVYGVARPGSVPFPVIVAGINNVMWVPAVGVLGTYVFLLFPDGREVTVQEVAPSSVAGRRSDRAALHLRWTLPRAAAEPRGRSQPVRDGELPLG